MVNDSDQLPARPNGGWPKWSQQQVENADKVLIACTPGWAECYEADGHYPLGSASVAARRIIRREMLYNQQFYQPKIPVHWYCWRRKISAAFRWLARYHHFHWHKPHDQAQSAGLADGQAPALPQSSPPSSPGRHCTPI